MKRTVKIKMISAGLTLVLGLTLAGCSEEPETSNSTPTSTASDNGGDEKTKVSEKNAVGVSQSINNYYVTLISESETALTNATKVEETIRETTGDETYESFVASENPFDAFKELDKEQSKKLADSLQSLNPSANLIDFSEMNDNDRSVLNLLIIASSTVMSTIADRTIEVTVPEDKVSIKKDKATVFYSDIVLTVDGEEQEMTDLLGNSSISLVYVDGSWKIDGQKTYEEIYANAQAEQAESSDGAEG